MTLTEETISLHAAMRQAEADAARINAEICQKNVEEAGNLKDELIFRGAPVPGTPDLTVAVAQWRDSMPLPVILHLFTRMACAALSEDQVWC